jgi:fatty acid desaturase
MRAATARPAFALVNAPPHPPFWQRWALPTWGVAAAAYGGFLLLTWNFVVLPPWLTVPALAFVLAWQGSLQHETIHGHPTRWRWINTALGWAPLALWLPYAVYRETHLRHHAAGSRNLTHPGHDPESHYASAGTLIRTGPIRRAVLRLNCTLGGRLVVGPAIVVLRLWAAELHRLSDRRRLGIWLRHAADVAIVLGWVVGVCKIPPFVYAATVVYPSISLALLRSFAEHRAARDPRHRTAIVEAHPFWALLFLNNQLHLAHHARPDLAWYQLPRAWREMASSAAIGSGLLFRGGYAEVARKCLFRPFITAEHPGGARE